MNGLLVVNLGTPDAPTPSAVRRYLREFLSDPRVIDIHPVGRALLLYLFILPFRPRKSAEAYLKVWTPRGSPLLTHSLDLVEKLRPRLAALPVTSPADGWVVELGMRYGSPSLPDAIDKLLGAGCDRLTVLPLYPQYAASSTGSSLEEVFRVLGQQWVVPSLTVVPPFYDDAGYLDAFAAVGAPVLAAERPDHVLFSFHGLPERQVRKSDATGAHCFSSTSCCDRIGAANRNCYRAQCFSTARDLTTRLGLVPGRYTVCFQSRLGRTPWIKPYTDELLPALASQGKKRLVVFCPAFVADCLETLEEVGLRARDQWKGLGGDSLALVPSLNSNDGWADAVIEMVRRQAALPSAALEPAQK